MTFAIHSIALVACLILASSARAQDATARAESMVQGTRTLVGLVTYPKRSIRWATAIGPVNGERGETVRDDTPFRIASVTKTFTAAAIFKLIEQGRFVLDAPIEDLLSEGSAAQLRIAGIDPAGISVRQLLSHRSGLHDYVTTDTYFSAIIADPARRWTRAEQLAIALDVGTPFPPDSHYLYADTNYILLGDIIEQATAQPLAASYRSLLNFSGLGLTGTYLESVEAPPQGLRPRLHSFVQGFDTYVIDASFDLYGGGGLVSTAKDLTTFYRALFAGRVIGRDSVAEMTRAVSGGGFGETAYGLGLMPFYIGNYECYGHEGFASVVVGHCPSIDYTFVYAAGSDQRTGIGLPGQSIGYRVAVLLGIDVQPKPYGNDFERTRCPPELQSNHARLSCGMLVVKESRGESANRRIRFPVAIAKHPTRPATIEPLLLLGGGPGDALFPNLPALLGDPDAAATLLDGQDIVAVEYRGVGAAQPALICDSPLTDNASISACVEKFTSVGVNLARYNSVDIASDLEQLRRSLRVSRWNVLGFSYGTRAALTLLRERPNSIKSLTLDGAFPPDAAFVDADLFARVLDEVMASCQSQLICAEAFPNLKLRLEDTLTTLNQLPLMLGDAAVTGDELVRILTAFQANPEILSYLPAVLDGFARRDMNLLDALLGSTGAAAQVDPNFSDAMFFSVECNEEVPFLDLSLVNAQASGNDPIRRGIARDLLNNVRICAQWPSGLGAAKENLPVPLSVPTMVFNGQFDLQTPPQTGRMLAASAPRARGVDFPAIGHIALLQSPACAIAIVARFQRGPDAQSVDTGCIAELPEAEWKTSLDAGFYRLLSGG